MQIDSFPNLSKQLETQDPKLVPFKNAVIELQKVVLELNRELEELKKWKASFVVVR